VFADVMIVGFPAVMSVIVPAVYDVSFAAGPVMQIFTPFDDFALICNSP
jgi:hypothetical protein